MKLHRCDNCGKDRLGDEKDKFWFELSRFPEKIIPSDAPVLMIKPRPPGKEFCSYTCVRAYCDYKEGFTFHSRIGKKIEEKGSHLASFTDFARRLRAELENLDP